MNIQDEDDNLQLDSFIEIENEEIKRFKKVSTVLIRNNDMAFGFFELTNALFYQIQTLSSAKMKIKNWKMLTITAKEKETKYSFVYHLIENQPSIIILAQKREVILSFRYPPKCFIGYYESVSPYLMENYNQCNNAYVLDSPFRHLIFSCESNEKANYIINQISLVSNSNEIHIETLAIESFDDYKRKLSASLESNSDFNTQYMAYANLSEILLKKKSESCISVMTNYRNELTFESLAKHNCDNNTKQKNKISFFIMKHIQITPNRIKIRKEMFHQSSRFLRLYYSNDNFIKVEFKDELDSQLYSNSSSGSRLHLLYETVFTKGLKICNKEYIFFLNPTNAMRSNSLWLIESSEAKEKLNYYYKELGLNDLSNDSKLCFPKLLSRLSQNFTSTTAYSGDFRVERIEDIQALDNKGIYNDGCGKISFELLKDICKKLNKNIFESAIQVRYKGAKGVFVVSPKLTGRCIQLTKSMVKFNCNNTNAIEIIRFSKYSTGYLNLQIIILLIMNGIKKNVIYSIAKKEVIAYKKKTCYYEPGIEKIIKIIGKENTKLTYQKDYMSTIAKSTYIYNRLANISMKYRFHLKNCGFFIGVIDFDSILEENEVFIQLKTPSNKTKIIKGDIIITKNPCLSIYDIQKVKGIENQHFASIFFNIIVFPAKGEIPLPSKISGSDLDGDIYWVCWDNRLTKIRKRNYYNKYAINYNNKVITQEEKYTIVNNTRRRKQFINIKKTSFKVEDNMLFMNKCLQFHCYYHQNYKLPDVNKQYLTIVNNLFRKNKHKDNNYFEIQILEELAVYHSIEVDFQKTGETSDFALDCIYPLYLTKKHLRTRMSFLYKIKELYDIYAYTVLSKNNDDTTSNSISNSLSNGKNNSNNGNDYQCFYDFFNKMIETENYDFNRKYLRLYQKKQIDKDFFERSFIYKIYELVSFTSHLKEAFMSSIYLMSDELFYNENLSAMQFTFEGLSINEVLDLLSSVKKIALNYENELKYIMIENDLINEIELTHLVNYFEPKIAIFKNDIEDYRTCLINQLTFLVNKSINDLKKINTRYTNDHLSSALFIIIYWIEGTGLSINKESNVMIDQIIHRNNRIKSIKDFIEKVVHHSSIEKMKFYLYDNFKSLTLYNLFLNNIYVRDN